MVELNLRDGDDFEPLDLTCAELLDLAESLVVRELENGDPVIEGSVVD